MKLTKEDYFCPCCGEVLDTFADHALTCICNGDRTVRHNVVRDVVFEAAVEAGMRAEREKANLLPPRPASDGLRAVDTARRPADVWIPRNRQGAAEALDFACTSGLRSDMLQRTSASGNIVFDVYESAKRQHLDTESHCVANGFKFLPMVLESHGGGWSPLFRKTLDEITKRISSSSGEVASLRVAQRISASLHRENARAVLRRLTPVSTTAAASGWGSVVEEDLPLP